MPEDKRGVKRKRFEGPEKELGTKIAGKLHHDLKEVKKAAKKAKTFETQKLVRKLKSLRIANGKETEITDCESQLEELKTLSLDAVAETAVRSKLGKDKMLSANEHIQSAISRELSLRLPTPADPRSHAAKVQSRFLSSKILSAEVAAAVEDLRNVLHPRATGADAEDDLGPPRKLAKMLAKTLDHPDGNAEISMDGVDDEDAAERVSIEGEDDAESLEEAGWDSGTVGDDERGQDDGWESGSLSGEPEDDGPPPKKATVKQAKAALSRPAAPSGQSTFLPSLSVGFIRGGSEDSDWSDGETNAGDMELKKNRRGQRARRAIWEKKYGRNANHKKKEAEEKTAERGRKPRHEKKTTTSHARTTTSNVSNAQNRSSKRVPSHVQSQQHQQPDSGWGQQRNAAAQPSSRSETKLHPSWEAKRKLKEMQSAAIPASVQSRKIKF